MNELNRKVAEKLVALAAKDADKNRYARVETSADVYCRPDVMVANGKVIIAYQTEDNGNPDNPFAPVIREFDAASDAVSFIADLLAKVSPVRPRSAEREMSRWQESVSEFVG